MNALGVGEVAVWTVWREMEGEVEEGRGVGRERRGRAN